LGALVLRFNHPTKGTASKSAQLEFDRAVKAFTEAVLLGPTQTGIRFQLVSALKVAGHADKARYEARRLLELNAKITHQSRQLPESQRKDVEDWLSSLSK
jgi:hypothetical protein